MLLKNYVCMLLHEEVGWIIFLCEVLITRLNGAQILLSHDEIFYCVIVLKCIFFAIMSRG